MNTIRKLIILLYVLLFIIQSQDVSAYNNSGTYGDNITWQYDEADGTLTISGSGDMGTEEVPWQSIMSKITTVKIDEGITNIADNAFYKALNLTDVTIPSTVISIGKKAFSFTGISSIKLPDTIQSIGYNCFGSCDNLTEIVIPGSLKEVSQSAFSCCSNLASVTIMDGVEKLCNNCFESTAIKKIDIPSSVTTIESAFYKCKSLESLLIPSTVTSVGKDLCFSCDSLRYVEFLGSCSISKSSFGGCENLVAFYVGDNVTSIDYFSFWSCKNLSSIWIPLTVTKIDNAAFYSGTKELTIYGVKDSEAHRYSDNNSFISFVDISDNEGKTRWDIAWIKAKLAPTASPIPTKKPTPTNMPSSTTQPSIKDNKKVATVKNIKVKLKKYRRTRVYTISWKKLSGVTGYEFNYSTKKKGKYKKIYLKAKTTVKKYSTSSRKKMYFKVRAFKTVDKKNIYGKFSKIISK